MPQIYAWQQSQMPVSCMFIVLPSFCLLGSQTLTSASEAIAAAIFSNKQSALAFIHVLVALYLCGQTEGQTVVCPMQTAGIYVQIYIVCYMQNWIEFTSPGKCVIVCAELQGMPYIVFIGTHYNVYVVCAFQPMKLLFWDAQWPHCYCPPPPINLLRNG